MTLRFEHVSLSIEGRAVIGPISLSLSERRIGVVGVNGAGKSSFMRLMAGLVKPDAGRVLLDGADVYADRKAALRGIGVIFQNPDHQILFPTVIEEMAFGLQQMGADKASAQDQARAVLRDHGRDTWAERNCYTLSGGQRHFLCLMAVLAMAPSMIVFDEPYAGLDIPTSAQLHRAIEALDQQVVMITHDPRLLDGFDRVIWLDAGNIAQDGPPADVLPVFEREMARRAAC